MSNVNLKATRDGLGEGLLELGRTNPKVLVLSADLGQSTRASWFQKEFPRRFIEVGVAEQNLIGVAAGLAQEGFIPYCASFAEFSPGRNWEQIKISVCYNDVPVKIVSTHAGLSVGADGATHQMLEDIAILRAMPNIIIISPCDALEAKKATVAAALINRPVYLRYSREETELITQEKDQFIIGEANVLRSGNDVTVLAHGLMVGQALAAADSIMGGVSLEVINVPTIKPLDEKTILKSLAKTKKAVVAEEAQIHGGLFSAIAELAAQKFPLPIGFVGVKDRFGQSGQPKDLLKKYCLTSYDIIKAVKNLPR